MQMGLSVTLMILVWNNTLKYKKEMGKIVYETAIEND